MHDIERLIDLLEIKPSVLGLPDFVIHQNTAWRRLANGMIEVTATFTAKPPQARLTPDPGPTSNHARVGPIRPQATPCLTVRPEMGRKPRQ